MKEIKYILLSLVLVAEPKLITVPVPTFQHVQVPVPVPQHWVQIRVWNLRPASDPDLDYSNLVPNSNQTFLR